MTKQQYNILNLVRNYKMHAVLIAYKSIGLCIANMNDYIAVMINQNVGNSNMCERSSRE